MRPGGARRSAFCSCLLPPLGEKALELVDGDEARAPLHLHGLDEGEDAPEALAGLSIENREQAWREAIASPSPRSHIFVAEGEVGVSGFASFGPTRDSDDDPEQVGELYAIYVLPEAWGKGVERSLMAKLWSTSHRWVPGVDPVGPCRQPANSRFYEFAGSRVDGATRHGVHLAVEVEELRYRIKLR